MSDALDQAQKRSLRSASRQSIVASFSAVRAVLRYSRWVSTANKYQRATVSQIQNHLSSSPPSLDSGNVAEYVAASVPLHLLDGWGYLGRSLDACARGDSDVARHLAYYAELRAAMSLLAHEGFGVFSQQHLIVDNTGRASQLPRRRFGTHVVTWLALEHWANLKKSADLLGSMIGAFGFSFAEWIDAFSQGGSTTSPIASKWLKRWGLDLRLMKEDREARNEASYRPTRLLARQSADVEQVTKFIYDLWQMCEPTGSGKFQRLDRFLVRRSLAYQFTAATGTRPTSRPAEFDRMIGSSLANLSGDDNLTRRFLTYQDSPAEPLILQYAERSDGVKSPLHHLQVIARAFLLLRVATGACRSLFQSGTLTEDKFSFWWEELGYDRGFWSRGSEPDILSDQWLDIGPFLDQLAEWGSAATDRSYFGWRHEQPSVVTVIGECERIGLWGLGD